MGLESIYVYGIIDKKTDEIFSVEGIGNTTSNVYCIPFKDVSAVVSSTSFTEYDPTEENTIAHEKVIQTVLKEDLTIAPMRFCTILKSRQDVLKLFNSAYLPFKKNIIRIRNKLELSIKVFLDVEKLRSKVNGADELVVKSREIAAELYSTLKTVSETNVLEEQITEDMILSASFLVRKETIAEFRRAIVEFDKKYTDVLKIRISGPTAPYNFVNMPTK